MSVVLPFPGGDFKPREFDVQAETMTVWDKGVFLNELLKQNIIVSGTGNGEGGANLIATKPLIKGTYQGTSLALTEVYKMLEEATASQFDSLGLEPIVPLKRELEEKRNLFQWSDGKDRCPPHLETVPPGDMDPNIFDPIKKLQVFLFANIFHFILPFGIEVLGGTPFLGPGIADCEKYNREKLDTDTDVMPGRNLGELPDWYSDARFAQQHLSGVNPTSIESISSEKVEEFSAEAARQGLDDMKHLLDNGKDLLMQDYSYFRKATGVADDASFENVIYDTLLENDSHDASTTKTMRYACASVVVFQLHEDGRLHPLAITLDYRGSLQNSITIFNRRLDPDDKGEIAEKDDWPWRYAKTCAQTADWARHEIGVHLVDTHLIEEAIIVATHRTIPEGHILYELLSPHWFRTLALNKAARDLMIPKVVCRLAGFGPEVDASKSRVMDFASWCYKNFDFQGKYVPTDLKKRGFDLESEMTDKYCNYPYGTLMYYLWGFIRDFVKAILDTQYPSDEAVQADEYIQGWCEEIHEKGQIKTFPTITTLDQLVDAVTMIIHIASTQHTAVNYLQQYYYDFVPSKPAALCTPLPADLEALKSYTENDLLAALPIGDQEGKWKDWLLSALLPQLLSYKVDGRYNLITYAMSLYNVNKSRTILEQKQFNSEAIKQAAAKFYENLKNMELMVDFVVAKQTEGTVPYPVLKPELTAVSILI